MHLSTIFVALMFAGWSAALPVANKNVLMERFADIDEQYVYGNYNLSKELS